MTKRSAKELPVAQPPPIEGSSSKKAKVPVEEVAQSSTTTGHVFVVGSGDCAQLGLGPDVFEKARPAKIAYFDDLGIVDVVAGGLHSVALSRTGKVTYVEQY